MEQGQSRIRTAKTVPKAREEEEQGRASLPTALEAGDLNAVPKLEYARLVATEGRRPIRLAPLMPGGKSDEIQCNVLYCDLEADIGYEALSYRWGDGTDRATIICDHSRLVITRSLEVALRQSPLVDRWHLHLSCSIPNQMLQKLEV